MKIWMIGGEKEAIVNSNEFQYLCAKFVKKNKRIGMHFLSGLKSSGPARPMAQS